jgi:hypothetical protein
MAQKRPVCIIPGMNHAQWSKGIVDTARGDLPSSAPQGPLLVTAARQILAFVEANHPSPSPDTAATAVAQLLQATTESVALLSPYTEALGKPHGHFQQCLSRSLSVACSSVPYHYIQFLLCIAGHCSAYLSCAAALALVIIVAPVINVYHGVLVAGRGSMQAMYDSNTNDKAQAIGVMAPSLFSYGAEMLPFSFANK